MELPHENCFHLTLKFVCSSLHAGVFQGEHTDTRLGRPLNVDKLDYQAECPFRSQVGRVREWHSAGDGPEGERVAAVVAAVESALADQMMDGFGGMPEDPNDVVVNDLMVREFRSRAEFPTWISRECIVRIYSVVRSQGYRIEQ